MRFLSSFSASLIVLGLGGSALAAPSSPATLEVGSFASAAGKPLSVAKDADDAALDAAARAVLADHSALATQVTLGPSRAVRLADGERIVKLPQMHAGLPVLHRGAAVSFGANGVANLVSSKLAQDLPGDATPALDAQTAALTASKVAGLGMEPKSAKLVFWPGPNGVVLAWTFYARPLHAGAYAPFVVVDAKTGKIIVRYNAALTVHQAQVYPTNPVKSPAVAPVTVPLPNGATTISTPLVKSHNCIDTKKAKPVDFGGQTFNIHVCELLQTATASAGSLDFTQAPAEDTATEDAFAELHIGYHTLKVYEMFRGFQAGFMVQGTPLDVIANLRMPAGLLQGDIATAGNPNIPLEPFQNAFFSPADPGNFFGILFGVSGGGLYFGQGPNKDYSYDADVIYHEFGHAVVEATAKLVGTPHLDEYGVVYSPGGMNEGLADYFAAALSGDPDVGEYAAKDIDPSLASIRSLAAPDACPGAIGGEVHQDATLFSGAIWDVRKTLNDDQKPQLDLAVFKAMNNAPSGDLSFDEMAKLIIAAAKGSSLGDPTAQALDQAFTKRGVLPNCTRILPYAGATMSGPVPVGAGIGAWFAPGAQATGLKSPLGYSPGVLQLHLALPSDATKLQITFSGTDIGQGGFGGAPFTPQVLVRFAEPITFTYGPYGTNPDVMTIPAQLTGQSQLKDYAASVDITAGAKDAYVMIVNGGDTDGIFTQLTLEHDGTPIEPTSSSSSSSGAGGNGATSGGWGSGGEGGEGGSGNGADPSNSGSCGCSVPGDAGLPAGAAFGALAALGVVVARRRRR